MSPPKIKVRRIIIFGETGVGKTCFNDMFVKNAHFTSYDPTLEDTSRKLLVVDGQSWLLDVIDINASLLRELNLALTASIFEQMIEHADGVVLLYDITSMSSYNYIINQGYLNIYLNRRSQCETGESFLCGRQRFGCVLVGNKADLAAEKREVDAELAQEWADYQGVKFFELDSYKPEPIEEAVRALVRSIIRAEKRDAEDMHWNKGAEMKAVEGKSQRMFPTLGDAIRQVLPKSKIGS